MIQLNKPRFVKIENELYEIDTDFRSAIKVEEILRDKSIGNMEKMLAVIYTLFGEHGLECKDMVKLLEKRNGICEYG